MMRQVRRQEYGRNDACRQHAEPVLRDLLIADKVEPNTDQHPATGVQKRI